MRTLVLFALTFGPSCAERAKEPASGPLNLLLITIDTLRADHLSCYGYPRPTSPTIDRLASEGAIFEEVITSRGQTWPSLTSLFTGEYPIVHGVRTNGQRMAVGRPTLAVDLSKAGYATAASLTNMIEAHHPGIDTIIKCRRFGTPQWRWDENAVTAGIDLLTETGATPWFFWFHLIDPHMPYAPPHPWDAVYRSRGAGTPPRAQLSDFRDLALSTEPVPQRTLDEYVALYDGQINGADANVARILAAVDSMGLRERTLVVLVADHGEDHFERNRYFGHSCSIYQQTMRVPLVMCLPGRVRPRIVSEPIEMIDLRPTILHLLGQPASAGIQGRSRADLLNVESHGGEAVDGSVRAPLDLQAVIEWSEEKVGGTRSFFAWRDREWTYVFNPDRHRVDNDFWADAEGPSYVVEREELYDLRVDPGERHNVVGEHPAVAERLRARLAERVQELRALAGTGVAASDSLDAETAEALRALGYVK